MCNTFNAAGSSLLMSAPVANTKKRQQVNLTEIILLTVGKVHILHLHFTTDAENQCFCISPLLHCIIVLEICFFSNYLF